MNEPIISAVELHAVATLLDTAARRLRAIAILAVPLKRICSWCDTVLSDGRLPATHAICPACILKMETGHKE
jgi:hypothetical protein